MNRKTSGMALTGFAAVLTLLAFTPASAAFLPTGSADSPVLYGMAELTLKNGDGDIVASSTVHNRLVDSGEAVLIQGTFGTLAAVDRPTVLCITDKPASLTDSTDDAAAELITADSVIPANTFGGEFSTPSVNTCITADINATAGSTAVLNATFYGSGATSPNAPNILENQNITSLAVCSAINGALFDCSNSGDLFSAVMVPRTPVGADDSVDVTYTFDLTSPSD